jgi:hypothetical protein
MQGIGETKGTGGARGRFWLGLTCLPALVLLSGCGWLFGDSPTNKQNARPGVDRKMPATGTLPAATDGGHDAGVVATDPAGNAQVGGIVPAKGGQKAQKEAAEKDAAERDAKDRETRESRDKRDTDERDARAKEEPGSASKPTVTNSTAGVPPKPAAAERGNASAPTTGSAPTAPATAAPSAPAQPPQPAQPAAPPAEQQPAAPPRT